MPWGRGRRSQGGRREEGKGDERAYLPEASDVSRHPTRDSPIYGVGGKRDQPAVREAAESPDEGRDEANRNVAEASISDSWRKRVYHVRDDVEFRG